MKNGHPKSLKSPTLGTQFVNFVQLEIAMKSMSFCLNEALIFPKLPLSTGILGSEVGGGGGGRETGCQVYAPNKVTFPLRFPYHCIPDFELAGSTVPVRLFSATMVKAPHRKSQVSNIEIMIDA